MLSPKSDRFLENIVTHVKFPFDRAVIKAELESHISDKTDYYTEQGYDNETAEQLSINDMGDAGEIGRALNKQHNPVLGWLWKITNTMVILAVIFSIFIVGIPFVSSFFIGSSPVKYIAESNIVYKIDLNEKVQMDDTIIHFTKVVYERNGNMNILYEYYDTRLWGMGWNLGVLWNIKDNLGNTYPSSPGDGSEGIKSKCIVTIKNFSNEADTLIISYDNYNRKCRLEIPLKTGEKHE